jgi:hypothetical protein
MFRKILFQDRPLRLRDFSEEDQMVIIQACCESFPEIAESSLAELIKVLYEMDFRELFGLDEDVPYS